MAGDFRAELAQQEFGESGCGYTRGGFAGGGAFEDVARVVEIKFLRAGEIGVTGAGRDEFFLRRIVFGSVFDGENFLPIGPVAIFDTQRDGGADRFSVADSGEDFGAIFFDFLAATAAVAELAAVELVIYEVYVDRKGSGQAGNEGQESLSVRFTGSVEAQHGD
jgi:hypothetical protein